MSELRLLSGVIRPIKPGRAAAAPGDVTADEGTDWLGMLWSLAASLVAPDEEEEEGIHQLTEALTCKNHSLTRLRRHAWWLYTMPTVSWRLSWAMFSTKSMIDTEILYFQYMGALIHSETSVTDSQHACRLVRTLIILMVELSGCDH